LKLAVIGGGSMSPSLIAVMNSRPVIVPKAASPARGSLQVIVLLVSLIRTRLAFKFEMQTN